MRISNSAHRANIALPSSMTSTSQPSPGSPQRLPPLRRHPDQPRQFFRPGSTTQGYSPNSSTPLPLRPSPDATTLTSAPPTGAPSVACPVFHQLQAQVPQTGRPLFPYVQLWSQSGPASPPISPHSAAALRRTRSSAPWSATTTSPANPVCHAEPPTSARTITKVRDWAGH